MNSYASTNYPEQSLTFPAPPGTPGWADATIYDPVRNLFYLTGNGNSVAVFNPKTQAFDQSLQSTFVSNGAVLQAEALTPDSSTLLVADPTDRLVIVFDLSAKTSAKVSVALPSDPSGIPVEPVSIVSALNRVFVTVTPCALDPVREINLTDLSVKARPDAASTCATYVPYPEFGAASLDGSVAIYAGSSGQEYGLQPSGPEYIWRYDALSDSFTGPVIVADSPWVGGLAALNGDGTVISLAQGVVDEQLLPLVPIVLPGMDARLNETGSVLYSASIESPQVALSDTHNGRSLLVLAAQNTKGTVIGSNRPLAVDPAGSQIVLALQDGIAYFQLATVPLAVGTVRPTTASPGGVVQLNGSGFVSGTTVIIGGQGATCMEVNNQILSCTVPNLAPGSTSISLNNPDGQTYSFENAFVVQ